MEKEIISEENEEELFQFLDKYIESMPLEVLELTKEKIKKENGDSSIIDQAIKNKIESQIINNKVENDVDPQYKVSLWKIIGSLLLNQNNTNGGYEPIQYEEEELEDDDFHYEDLD